MAFRGVQLRFFIQLIHRAPSQNILRGYVLESCTYESSRLEMAKKLTAENYHNRDYAQEVMLPSDKLNFGKHMSNKDDIVAGKGPALDGSHLQSDYRAGTDRFF